MKTIRKENRFVAISIALVALGLLTTSAVAHAQSAATSVTTQMGPGASGAQVSALQTFLAATPSIYPSGLVTGYYGSLTEAAVQAYQCQNGIVCQGNPSSTGYGQVGPSTLAKIEVQEGISAGGGVSLPSVGTSSTGPDIDAPVLGLPMVATSSTSAMISWTTNEPATDLVMYATTPPALSYQAFAAMPSTTDPTFGTSNPAITLTGLSPNTTYYYVLESTDASGNVQYGIGHSFTTNP